MTLIVMNGNVYYEVGSDYFIYIGQHEDVVMLEPEDLVRLIHQELAKAKGFHLSKEPRMVQ